MPSPPVGAFATRDVGGATRFERLDALGAVTDELCRDECAWTGPELMVGT